MPQHAATIGQQKPDHSDIWQADLENQESDHSDYYQADQLDDLDLSDPLFELAAIKIQRQARVMIARNNFRVCLYKLILLKNILDTKLHKEKMQMLFAFEQLIINTEDPNDQTQNDVQYFDDEQAELQKMLQAEDDPYLREQIT